MPALFTLLFLFGPDTHGEGLTLRQHMQAIGQLMGAVQNAVSAADFQLAADDSRAMRGHLIESIALAPAITGQMEKPIRDAAMIEYHQLMSRAIYMTASLERAITESDYESQSASREADIANLLRELQKLMQKAHAKFKERGQVNPSMPREFGSTRLKHESFTL